MLGVRFFAHNRPDDYSGSSSAYRSANPALRKPSYQYFSASL